VTEDIRKFALSAVSTEGLADKRQVLVRISSEGVDRQGDIVVQAGLDTRSFMGTGGTVLWGHDPDQPIARCVSIERVGQETRALAQFPEHGVSAKADEIYGLIKASIISSSSIGFRSLEREPIDPKDPWGGQKFLKTELMEFSFVSVPANADATVIARQAGGGAHSDETKMSQAKVKFADEIAWLLADDAEAARDPVSYVKRLIEAEKGGRVLSAANLEHVKGLEKCLAAMTECHQKALDSHGQTQAQLQAFSEQLSAAAEHAKSLKESARKKPKPEDAEDDGDDDGGDEDDGADDGDDDVELAAAVRRKNLLAIAELTAR
jgi:HK97 family phage prohead protease